MTPLSERRCKPQAPGTAPLTSPEVDSLLREIPGWSLSAGAISKTWTFRDFHETMGFINAVAWIANREDHHPDAELGYGRCSLRYSTHSIGGLSENDFICAARIEALQR